MKHNNFIFNNDVVNISLGPLVSGQIDHIQLNKRRIEKMNYYACNRKYYYDGLTYNSTHSSTYGSIYGYEYKYDGCEPKIINNNNNNNILMECCINDELLVLINLISKYEI